MLRQSLQLFGFLSAVFFSIVPSLTAQGSNGYFSNANCQNLLNTGGCVTDAPYMSENCQITCETPTTPKPKEKECVIEHPKPPAPECLNSSPCCEKWQRENKGICKSNEIVKKKCRAACGQCKRKTCPGCNDLSAKCEKKKNDGEKCSSDWMAENCRKTCGLCYENKEAFCGYPPPKPTNPCETEMAEFALCMNENYGQTRFNPNQNIPFDKYECQLKSCLGNCRRSIHTAGCDKGSQGKLGASEDRLVGSVETSSGTIDLHSISKSKTKALDCALETVTRLLQPKIEECVRKRLNLSKKFHLRVLNLEQFLELEDQSSAMMIEARTFHLQEISANLVNAAATTCESKDKKKAKDCVFKTIIDVLLKVGNPKLHAYKEQLSYCKNVTDCSARLSGSCIKFNDEMLRVISECSTEKAKEMKEKLIADYLVCLSQKPGFPDDVAHLNKDPTVKKQLSTTFDETLETMDDNVDEVVKNPCETPLFPSVEWDTVAFFNVETKHTTICQRSPKVSKMEAQQQSGRVKRRQPETPQEKGIKKDICSDPDKYLAITSQSSSSSILEERFKRSDPQSPDYANPARPIGEDIIGQLMTVLEKAGAVLILPDYGGGAKGGSRAVFSGPTPKPRYF